MAALLPVYQRQLDLPNGVVCLVTRVRLLSASDTITVPNLANTTASASSDQLREANDNAVTITDNGNNTVTLVGTAGDFCTVVSLHNFTNFGDEA